MTVSMASSLRDSDALDFSQPRVQGLHETFHHQIDVYLKDSNAYANTYFARYFEWQGVCRERWFHKCISPDMLQNQGVFVTKSAHQEYRQETFPFQSVSCKLNTYHIKQCSFSLLFRFFVDDHLVSFGYQQVVFTSRDKRIQRLPAEILSKVRKFELPSTSAFLNELHAPANHAS